jgi:hypothetical protein
LVSILLPVYNGAVDIGHALASVCAQTYPNWELIVIDDGSTDHTAAVVRRWLLRDSRIRLVQQQNSGTAQARNRGLQQARGAWIGMIDADDQWLPTKLATELAVAETLSHAGRFCQGIIYSSYWGVDTDGVLVCRPPVFHRQGLLMDWLLETESVLLPSTVLIHRQVFTVVGGFTPHHYHEDREFFLRASKLFPLYPTGKRLVAYRQSMSGKCRRLLSEPDRAVYEELSIVDSLRTLLTETQAARLHVAQTRNLVFRFLMYGHLTAARTLARRLPQTALGGWRPKPLLARLSLATGWPCMAWARVMMQLLYRCLAIRPQQGQAFPMPHATSTQTPSKTLAYATDSPT